MLRKKLWTAFRKLDIFLDVHAFELLLVLIVLFVRLPTIAEPYWYGDEAIYLTIGNSLRAGERLYVDIIDHKTPLIYYIAQLGNTQFGFRMIATAAIAVSTVAFFMLTRDFFRPKMRIIAVTIFILYTNLPRFEGNIPNGETFVMTFVLLALLAFRKTKVYQTFLDSSVSMPSRTSIATSSMNTVWLFVTGALMGLATLTKVPAVFDFAIVFVVAWFVFIEVLITARQKHARMNSTVSVVKSVTLSLLVQMGIVFCGWVVVILGSVVYYFFRGSLKEYIDYGLLYNFRYAGSWKPQFSSEFIAFFFTLKGKFLLLGAWILGLSFFKRSLSPGFLLGGAWLGLALVAATLSNRPYPHYFLQVFPALALVITALLWVVIMCIHRCRDQKGVVVCDLDAAKPVVEALGSFVIISALVATISFLHVTPYPTVKYYDLFFKLSTKQISWPEYRDQFNSVLNDNYKVAQLLERSPDLEMFIWGNNPILYALRGKNPVGRFTVAFHIDDFNAYGETITAIEEKKPTYVVVMKDQTPLPGLSEYLTAHYIPNSDYQTMTVWKRSIR